MQLNSYQTVALSVLSTFLRESTMVGAVSAFLQQADIAYQAQPFDEAPCFPDFIAELLDGRLAVIEYKGTRLRNDHYEIEKRKVGELWAASSGGKCVFKFVCLEDGGLNMGSQINRAFNEGA